MTGAFQLQQAVKFFARFTLPALPARRCEASLRRQQISIEKGTEQIFDKFGIHSLAAVSVLGTGGLAVAPDREPDVVGDDARIGARVSGQRSKMEQARR